MSAKDVPECPGCGRDFPKGKKALTMHMYHSKSCYAYVCYEAYSDSATNQQATNYFDNRINDIACSTTNAMHDDEDDPMEIADDSEELAMDGPFELTKEYLDKIPGETSTVPHTIEQRVHTELLFLLAKAEAPDYLFQDIIDWAANASALNYNFRPKVSTRQAVLNDLEDHFNTEDSRPNVSELKLEGVTELIPIVHFNFRKTILSLLTNPKLMQPKNLVINSSTTKADGSIDVSPWFQPYVAPAGSCIDDVLSGSWYRDTVQKYRNVPKLFLCPLIFYVDTTFIDPMKSNFHLEPVNVTFALFKRECRMAFEFWKTLGFLCDTDDADEDHAEAGYKPRNYHSMLEFLLQDVIYLHSHPEEFDNFPLRIGNYIDHVNMRFPVAFIISDTQGADKLCGRYINYTTKVQRLHRLCTCAPLQATVVEPSCTWVTMDEMMNVIDRANSDELKKYSQHCIPDHAFRYMDFGSNTFGIYAATTNDILHGVKLGVIHYVLEIFIKGELTPMARQALEQAVKQTIPHLKQGGNQQFPRIYFPNGVTNLKNSTADENVGVMFMLFILSVTTQGKAALQKVDTMTIARINNYVKLFERLLTFLLWLSHKEGGYWKLNDTRAIRLASKKVESLVSHIRDNFPRSWGQGWNLSKMHELLHSVRMINLFGSPSNFDSGPCERMHKDVAKRPGRAAQKRHETFTAQAAQRLSDRYLLDLAYQKLVVDNEIPPPSITTSTAVCSGSSFGISIKFVPNTNGGTKCQVRAHGFGQLVACDLRQDLYPGLVEYIAAYFVSNFDGIPTTIYCASEYRDDNSNIFRAHHSFRSNGFWHDYAWVSYADDRSPDGFTNVPAKILTFLPEGLPGVPGCHAVVHPCGWRSTRVTELISSWTLVTAPARPNTADGRYPFDIVPVSSIFKHCFAIPDLNPDVSDTIFVVREVEEWCNYF